MANNPRFTFTTFKTKCKSWHTSSSVHNGTHRSWSVVLGLLEPASTCNWAYCCDWQSKIHIDDFLKHPKCDTNPNSAHNGAHITHEGAWAPCVHFFFNRGRFLLRPPHALYVLVVFYTRDLSLNPLLVLRLLEPVQPPIEHIIGIVNSEIHICDFPNKHDSDLNSVHDGTHHSWRYVGLVWSIFSTGRLYLSEERGIIAQAYLSNSSNKMS